LNLQDLAAKLLANMGISRPSPAGMPPKSGGYYPARGAVSIVDNDGKETATQYDQDPALLDEMLRRVYAKHQLFNTLNPLIEQLKGAGKSGIQQ
jgi:hypothetical protein